MGWRVICTGFGAMLVVLLVVVAVTVSWPRSSGSHAPARGVEPPRSAEPRTADPSAIVEAPAQRTPQLPVPVPGPASAPGAQAEARPHPAADVGPLRVMLEFHAPYAFDPMLLRATAAQLLARGEEVALGQLRELTRQSPSLDLAPLIAFSWNGDPGSMPHYMLVDEGEIVLPWIRQSFGRFPILERGGIPFLLEGLAFELSPQARSRRGGSSGRSHAGFFEWAEQGSMRPGLPPLTADPLTAASELGAEVVALLLAASGTAPHSLTRALREQAYRCLGPRAREAVRLELGLELDEIRWNDEAWSDLRAWISRQDAAWSRNRYELSDER